MSRIRREDVLNENEALPTENTILSFHAELPVPLSTLPNSSSSSSSSYSRNMSSREEAEDFLQLLKRKRESNLNNLIIQQTQVRMDQFSLSLGDKSPPPPPHHQQQQQQQQQQEQQQQQQLEDGGAFGTTDRAFGDISSLVYERNHSEDGKEYTLNIDMAVQVVETIMCICRGNKVEDFDVKGGLRLSTLNAISDREGNTSMHHIIPYYIMPYHIIPYHIISYHIISYHTISYHIIPYHTISYHIIPYHTISHHIISYNISFPIQSTFTRIH